MNAQIFSLAPPTESRTVIPGDVAQVSFVTSRIMEHAPSESDLKGARLIFAPRAKPKPKFLNYVARLYQQVNDQCDGIMCSYRDRPLQRSIRTLLHTLAGESQLPVLGANTDGMWARANRFFHQIWHQENENRGFYVLRKIDLDVGELLYRQADKIRLSDGRWQVTADVFIPQSVAHYDPEYYESQILLALPGSNGAMTLLGRSIDVYQVEHVAPGYKLDFSDQLAAYGFETRDDRGSIDFTFQIPSSITVTAMKIVEPALPADLFLDHSTSEASTAEIKFNGRREDGNYGKIRIKFVSRPPLSLYDFSASIYIIDGEHSSYRRIPFQNTVSLFPSTIYRRGIKPTVRYNRRSNTITVSFRVLPQFDKLVPVTSKADAERKGALVDEQCWACLNDLKTKNGDVVKFPKCQHTGHEECVKEWLLRTDACPLCRKAQRIYERE